MSFKDHTDFNVAMIGKQERKFLNEPISTVSCVFEAMYFIQEPTLAQIT